MENKLEITTLLKSSKTVSDSSQKKMSATQSIWLHEKSVLAVKNTKNVTINTSNKTKIEEVIMDNNIPVSQLYKNRSGDMVAVCKSKDTSDVLKNLVASDNEEIVLVTWQERCHSITIVGLPRENRHDRNVG